MVHVEGFELDHNTVRAPYVRLVNTEQDDGALVEKYGLRFLQPNKDALPTDALHMLEHLLAVNMRDELKGTIDTSPMGCRTGLYMIVRDQHSPREVHDALVNILDKVINTEVVPAVSTKECGNYKDHSLFAVREYAKIVLDQRISLDPSERALQSSAINDREAHY